MTKYNKQVEIVLLAALAKGATVVQAAHQAGVSERTAYRRLQQPAFQARIEALQEETLRRAADVLTAAAQKGLLSLVDLQKPTTPPSVRRGAARDIIELGLRLREATVVEKRVAALEKSTVVHQTSAVSGAAPTASVHHRRRGDATLQVALASGESVAQAASKAGLSERTVYRRLQESTFQQRLEVLRADMVQRAAATLIAATLVAVKTLTDLQDPSTPASVRRRASRDIIELGQKLRECTFLEKRLVALEKQWDLAPDS